MGDALDLIMQFQTDRGLDKKPYNDLNEQTNIVEELLEAVGLNVSKENRDFLKLEFDYFITRQLHLGVAVKTTEANPEVDAYCDIIVFAVGALMKLGYDPKKALLEVGREILSRKGSMVNGKFEKDLSEEAKANWYKADFSKCKRK